MSLKLLDARKQLYSCSTDVRHRQSVGISPSTVQLVFSVFYARVVFLRLVLPATLLADLCSVYSYTWEGEWSFQRDFRREMSGQCRRKFLASR